MKSPTDILQSRAPMRVVKNSYVFLGTIAATLVLWWFLMGATLGSAVLIGALVAGWSSAWSG